MTTCVPISKPIINEKVLIIYSVQWLPWFLMLHDIRSLPKLYPLSLLVTIGQSGCVLQI